MSHATPRIRYFAKLLIAHEAGNHDSSRTEIQTAFGVIRKLRPVLEELMGNTGFRALVSRSMLLAEEEVPGLGGARMNADGSLEGFEESQVKTGPEESSEGGAVMLAWMLGLLGSFIGELLTMQLVLEVWPDLSLNGYCSQGEDHEETN
jgi:hypothetical protein